MPASVSADVSQRNLENVGKHSDTVPNNVYECSGDLSDLDLV